jgi:cytochrome c oxidase cbb3-type subunit 3
MKSQKVDPIQGEILHEYDGILEADNQLPRWWVACLVGSIVFAAGYWGWFEVFHVTAGTEEAYAAVMAERALSGGEPTPDVLAVIASDRETVGAGARTFASQCAVCHGADGSGVIGPNLTDAAWLHGSEPLDVYRTVRDGVGARGMPTWGPVLGPRGVLEVSAFVLSIRGTNLPGRAPEGVIGGEVHAAVDEVAEP